MNPFAPQVRALLRKELRQFSRSRGALWTKGETSGNRLEIKRILVDCDEDTVLLRVVPLGDGVACHTGERSCFFRELTERGLERADREPQGNRR